ncbi:o-succinylbenzoate synthase [Halorubrum ezzemoulense]|uniref:o-succinylbenzoate synthase n=2 Tax=Halorubrum TaxID=56688 RepID=A0A256J5L7_HALEZ|nr:MULTISPECIES: o-succinylbenzoate synthase [Halorubrum]MDB2263073.1 o-succinylbenzoate synthase [Halorubrum ezzemoulense]MDB9252134.1 o-succinylbenzoate synthase [Halorubrum ezzemoulense]MDB9254768.1 o-succinylbenzoate synthase [Halorubrum ezzemoulense]MDB9275479.1 o-succinylbenzoate synthase [Halorubrum ezzemoulense]MDB9278440.1 o-succinylbenzoate synthase [Halorubrum ezzemoulense]
MTDDDPRGEASVTVVRHRPFALDLTRPLGTARGEIRRREGFVITARRGGDESGAVGLGEATPLPGWTESRDACAAALGDLEAGNMSEPVPGVPDAESTPAARHGVSLALADAAARDAGRPLAEQLAVEAGVTATPADAVPVNATVGDGGPAETAAEATRAVEEGFDCLKLKVGARDVDADVERLRAVRDAVGDRVALRADANGAWDRETARHALGALAAFDLAYVEQPLPADDLGGLAELRRDGGGERVPIAADESVAVHGVDAVLEADAADAVVLKPMALGGPDRALAAALRARSAGVDPVVTTTIDAVVARTAAVHVAAAVPEVSPCGLATGTLLDEDLAPDPSPVAEGAVAVPLGPGLAGAAFDDLRRS